MIILLLNFIEDARPKSNLGSVQRYLFCLLDVCVTESDISVRIDEHIYILLN
jgi:hypothetical protein